MERRSRSLDCRRPDSVRLDLSQASDGQSECSVVAGIVECSELWAGAGLDDAAARLVPATDSTCLPKSLFAVAVCMVAMQGFTILVFEAMHIGYALASFNWAVLVSVYLAIDCSAKLSSGEG